MHKLDIVSVQPVVEANVDDYLENVGVYDLIFHSMQHVFCFHGSGAQFLHETKFGNQPSWVDISDGGISY